MNKIIKQLSDLCERIVNININTEELHELVTQKTTCGRYCVTLDGKQMKGKYSVIYTFGADVYLDGNKVFGYKDDSPNYFTSFVKIDHTNYNFIKHYFE